MARPPPCDASSHGSNRLTQSSSKPLLPQRESDRSSETVDVDFLSPPQTPGELEDLPYKPCCSSSESLNMLQRGAKEHGHDGHKHRTKKKHSREKVEMQLAASLQYQNSHENDSSRFNGLPDCQKSAATATSTEGRYNQPRSSAESIGIPQNMVKATEDDIEDCSSQSRRTGTGKTKWTSVSIRGKAIPEIKLQIITAERKLVDIEHLTSSSGKHGHKESSFNKAVRERLTNRKKIDIHPPPPVSITLSRPNETALSESGKFISRSDMSNFIIPNSGQARGCNQLVSYSISVEENDSMIKSVQPSFQRQTPPDGISNLKNKKSLLGGDTRRPSVVGRGVMPQASIPAVCAMTIDIVRQVGSTHITFEEMRRPSMQPRWNSKRVTKTPRASVPEVIWDGNQPLSRYSHSTVSVSDEASCGSVSTANSTNSDVSRDKPGRLYHASHFPKIAPKKHTDLSNQADISVTRPVPQWILSDAAKEARKSPDISPTQSLSSLSNPTPDADQEIISQKSQINFAEHSDVFFFPPLPSRKSTVQWISPLPDISAPEFEVMEKKLPSSSVRECVDAPSAKPSMSNFEVSEQEISEEVSEAHKNALSPGLKTLRRPHSANLLHPQPLPRLWEPVKPGSAIGCSSRARRKSSVHSLHIRIDDKGLKSRSHGDESTWIKPRKDSGWPAATTPSPAETSSMSSSGRISPPGMPTPIEVQRTRRTEEDRMNLIEEFAPLLSKVDHAGIYQTVTGSRMGTAHCEADCRPHVCGESRDGSRVPSKDWIG